MIVLFTHFLINLDYELNTSVRTEVYVGVRSDSRRDQCPCGRLGYRLGKMEEDFAVLGIVAYVV
jgi:hypothetical protein